MASGGKRKRKGKSKPNKSGIGKRISRAQRWTHKNNERTGEENNISHNIVKRNYERKR